MADIKPEEFYPKVGITVMVFKDGKVLMGKRKGSHGAGEWAFPGGSMEYMERIADTVHREVAEEAGIAVGEPEFVRLYNLREYPPKHFIDVAVRVDWVSGEPKVMEEVKCDGWEWIDLDKLPTPLFAGTESIVEAYKTGRVYYDK